jgi:hypothetical protein
VQLRRLIFWYDTLTDWQRVQYALAAILFLVACAGYLLGLGSTMVVQRMEMESAALAAQPLPTEPAGTPTSEALPVVAPAVAVTLSSQATPTVVEPTAQPSQTLFSAPQIAEPPAAPRRLPAAPVPVAPVAPAAPVRAAPTADRPRNLETSKPEPPPSSVTTPTRGVVRTIQPSAPTAVRQSSTAATSTVRPGTAGPTSRTPLPTLALPATPYPTTPPTAPAVRAAATPTRAAQPAPPTPAPVRTPQAH